MEKGSIDLTSAKNVLKTAMNIDDAVEPISDAIADGNIPLQTINVLVENTVSQVAAMMDGLNAATEQTASNQVSIEIAKIILNTASIDLTDSATITTIITNTLTSLGATTDSNMISDVTQIVSTINATLVASVANETEADIAFESLVKIQIAAEATEQELENGVENGDLSTALANVTSSVFTDRIEAAQTGTITHLDINSVSSIDEDSIFEGTYYIGSALSEFNGSTTFPVSEVITLTLNGEDNQKVEVDVNITVNQDGSYSFSEIDGQDVNIILEGQTARINLNYKVEGSQETSKLFLEVNGSNTAPYVKTIGGEMVADSEFQVNTHTNSYQYDSAITSLNDGGYVISWSSAYQDGSGYGVFAQQFNANGEKVGAETQVNTYTNSYQLDSAITALDNGGYVIAWQSYYKDGSGYGVYTQQFNANGQKVGTETQVNTHTNSHQLQPAVTSLDNGGYVVTWASAYQDGSGYGVFAQQFDTNGEKVGAETQVNTYASSTQYLPDIASLEDGSYVITWASYQDGSSYGVYAQKFNVNGEKIGAETQVNTYTNSTQYDPSISALKDGGYIITWSSNGQEWFFLWNCCTTV